MTGWAIDLRPRPEPRSPGARVAVIGTIFVLATLGLSIGFAGIIR